MKTLTNSRKENDMLSEQYNKITDDNGTALETGMIVELSEAYYSEQNGY